MCYAVSRLEQNGAQRPKRRRGRTSTTTVHVVRPSFAPTQGQGRRRISDPQMNLRHIFAQGTVFALFSLSCRASFVVVCLRVMFKHFGCSSFSSPPLHSAICASDQHENNTRTQRLHQPPTTNHQPPTTNHHSIATTNVVTTLTMQRREGKKVSRCDNIDNTPTTSRFMTARFTTTKSPTTTSPTTTSPTSNVTALVKLYYNPTTTQQQPNNNKQQQQQPKDNPTTRRQHHNTTTLTTTPTTTTTQRQHRQQSTLSLARSLARWPARTNMTRGYRLDRRRRCCSSSVRPSVAVVVV